MKGLIKIEKKITTTIQYQLTNVKLFNDIFTNWSEFNECLKKGPEAMKEKFLNDWNIVKEYLKNSEKFIVQDFEKDVSKDDFDITINKTKKGTNVFFFSFPNSEYRNAASKYVALVLAPNRPRYITLEFSKSILDNKETFVLGEFYIDEKENKKMHKNYGQVDNDRITYFAGYVLGMLDGENV